MGWSGPYIPQYPDAKTESDKTVLALALGGIQAVHFDNLGEGRFYGDSSLDSALTTTVKGGRILGMSRIAQGVPLRPWWALSGNNITRQRHYRRWLQCNLQTPLEKPYERGDVSSDELVEHVTRDPRTDHHRRSHDPRRARPSRQTITRTAEARQF